MADERFMGHSLVASGTGRRRSRFAIRGLARGGSLVPTARIAASAPEPSPRLSVAIATLLNSPAWNLRLYNNLHSPARNLHAARSRRASTMYLCGPTVYNYVHIGNARGPVVFDVLAALLRRRYPQLALRPQHHRRRRQDQRGRRANWACRSRRSPTSSPPPTATTWPRWASAPPGHRAARHRAHAADHRA